MDETLYTLGVWQVRPGQETAFVEAWRALGNVFRQLPQPPSGTGTLVQSLADPALFYSFGPWRTQADIQAMRDDPQAQAALNRLRELCLEARPGAFRVVAEA